MHGNRKIVIKQAKSQDNLVDFFKLSFQCLLNGAKKFLQFCLGRTVDCLCYKNFKEI